MNVRQWLAAFLKLGCAVALVAGNAFADSQSRQIRCHWNSDRAGDFILNTYSGSATLAVDIYTTDFAALGLDVPSSAYYARLYLSPLATSPISAADPFQAELDATTGLVEFLDGGERSLGFQDNLKLTVQLRSVHKNASLSYELGIVRDSARRINTAFQYLLGTQADEATCSAS